MRRPSQDSGLASTARSTDPRRLRTDKLRHPATLEAVDFTHPRRLNARLLTRLAKLDLLALDDWMIAPLRDAERCDLTEVIEDRAERASTLIASQLPVTDWHAVIGDSNQGRRHLRPPAPRRASHRDEAPLDATDAPGPEDPHVGDDISIPTPACTPAARPDPVPRTASPTGAGRPMDRTGGMENAHDTLAADCTRVEARFPPRLGL